MPAPLSHHESARLAALRDCGVLDTPPEIAFDRIVGLAADTLDMPMASISFVDHDRLWRKAARGLPAGESPLEASFCAHAIIGDGFLVVPDAAADARFARNPAVTGAPGIRFYAGAVLRMPTGQPLGTLCVFDRQPRELGERERKILRDLADLVVDELSLRTRCQRLNESHASSANRTLPASAGPKTAPRNCLAPIRPFLKARAVFASFSTRPATRPWFTTPMAAWWTSTKPPAPRSGIRAPNCSR